MTFFCQMIIALPSTTPEITKLKPVSILPDTGVMVYAAEKVPLVKAVPSPTRIGLGAPAVVRKLTCGRALTVTVGDGAK
jgi:hypothetical protein